MKALIWSKETCPYCVRAKKLLERKGVEFEERVIDGETWKREDLLEMVPEAKTVPQIFLDGTLIGGYDNLFDYFYKN